MIVPATMAQFWPNVGPARAMSDVFAVNSWPYHLAFGLLIIFFTYFYTAIIYNPVDIAENLKKQGAFVPGIKPGANTAKYIDKVMTRISLPGSLFLAAIAIIPSIILESLGVSG
jgi:preprotein translocase subunit SecY